MVNITIREYPPAMMVENFLFELSKQPIESRDLGLRLAAMRRRPARAWGCQ
jgi:hypothetical protein